MHLAAWKSQSSPVSLDSPIPIGSSKDEETVGTIQKISLPTWAEGSAKDFTISQQQLNVCHRYSAAMRAKVDGNLGPASRRRVIYVRKPELRITDGTAFQENVLMDVNTKMQPFKEFWLTKEVCLHGSTESNPAHTNKSNPRTKMNLYEMNNTNHSVFTYTCYRRLDRWKCW